MAFTYKNPTRSTDPQAALEGARAIVVGARSYRIAATAPTVDASDGRRRAVRAARSLQAPRRRAARRRGRAQGARLQGAGGRGRQRARRPRGGVPSRPRLVRQERQHLVAGPRARGSCSARSSPTLLCRANDGPVDDGCGSCRRCVDGCPTGAIVAPGVVDARRCLAWLVQSPGVFPRDTRAALGNRLYGCDECQEVCPPNIVARPSPATSPPPRRGSTCSICSPRLTRRCSNGTAAGTSPTGPCGTSAGTR